MTRIASISKPGATLPKLSPNAGEESVADLDKLRYANGSLSTADIRLNMQKVMQDNAAVYRTQETLSEGVKLIDKAVRVRREHRLMLNRPYDCYGPSCCHRRVNSLWHVTGDCVYIISNIVERGALI